MASIKIKFRQSSIKNREGTLYFQIIHRRQVRQIYLNIHIYAREWNEQAASVYIGEINDSERRHYLCSVRERIDCEAAQLKAIVDRLESAEAPFSAADIVQAYNDNCVCDGFVSFSHRLIEELDRVGKYGMSSRFRTTLNSLLRFYGEPEIEWNRFSSSMLCGFEEYMLRCGLCRNTTSFYMRNLRSMYNRARENECQVPANPFKHVYMGVDKTAKRAVSLATIRLIRDADLSAHPKLEFARNIFMLSFYTRGMSFIDIAYLRKNDVQYGFIIYHRRKTRRLLKVKIVKEIRDVLESFGETGTGYVVPVITSSEASPYSQYKSAYYRINRDLKKVGRMIGLDVPLTLYVARHTWASIAKTHNVPISIISEAMGHGSEATTRIYLSTLDSSSIDKANRRVISLLDRNTI